MLRARSFLSAVLVGLTAVAGATVPAGPALAFTGIPGMPQAAESLQEGAARLKAMSAQVLPLPYAPYKAPGYRYEIRGKVVSVADGDTVTLLEPGNRQSIIRLADIDAPESYKNVSKPGQPFSKASKQALSGMVFGKEIVARCHETDKYQRNVCRLFVPASGGELDVNMQMTLAGMAWANTADPRYLRDRSILGAQESARGGRLGVWSQPGAQAPWEWRRGCWEGARVCPNAE
jgi:micrococcal nuclease